MRVVVIAGALAAAVVTWAALIGGEKLESVGADDGTGTTCMPLSKGGDAWFAWESVENVSDSDLVVTGIELDAGELTVSEWFLADPYWEEAGVGHGQLPEAGESKWAATIAPGKSALVAMTVHADELDARRKTRPTLSYEVDGKAEELLLNWELEVTPADEAC